MTGLALLLSLLSYGLLCCSLGLFTGYGWGLHDARRPKDPIHDQ